MDVKFVDATTALMIWEAMNESRDIASGLGDLWDQHGTAAMRHIALRMAPAANAFWDALDDEERQALIPFDFEVIPAIVSATNWGLLSDRVYDGDVIALQEGIAPVVRKESYPQAVREYAENVYAYGDLADEFEEQDFEKAIARGISPKDFVEGHASKHNLTSKAESRSGWPIL